MAILPVLTYPNPTLKKPSRDVKDFNTWLKELVANLFETMAVEGGIGLAAPQVGENLNMFVMDVSQEDARNPTGITHHKICMVNPKIINAQGQIAFEEGCLSCPELLVKVDRYKDIVVASFDMEGNPQKHVLTDLEAVCTQHEMDHLKGILLVDKVSALKRELYSKKRFRKRKGDKDVSLL